MALITPAPSTESASAPGSAPGGAPAADINAPEQGRAGRRGSLGALALLVAIYLALGYGYAVTLPRWYAPDEPAHYNYVRHLAETGTLPILEPGDFDAAYVDELKSAKPPFPADRPIDSIRYEAHQPPLYYVYAALVYRLLAPWLGDATPLGLRVASLLLGAATLALTWATARRLLPGEPWFAAAAAGVVALVPMRIAMAAAINNDTMVEVVLTALTLTLIGGVTGGFGRRRLLLAGTLTGLALLSKLVGFVAPGLVGLALLLRGALDARATCPGWPAAVLTALRAGSFWRRLALTLGVALVLAAPWFGRAMSVYGPGDPLAMRRHDAVMGDEPRTWQFFDRFGPRAAVERWLATLTQSFWAQFGWMSILIETRYYTLLNVLAGLAALGGLGAALRLARGRAGPTPGDAPIQAPVGVLLAGLAMAVTATVVYYNLQFWQPQGRYLFPAIAAFGTLGVLGLREVLAPPYRLPLLTVLGLGLVALNLACLRLYIVGFFR